MARRRCRQNAIEYVLTTGGNWALGNIGEFNLTIDKGDPKNLVSFCGEGVDQDRPDPVRGPCEGF